MNVIFPIVRQPSPVMCIHVEIEYIDFLSRRAFGIFTVNREMKEKTSSSRLFLSLTLLASSRTDATRRGKIKKASRGIEWEWESINPQNKAQQHMKNMKCKKKSWMECIILEWADGLWEINRNGHMPQQIIDSIKNNNLINHRCRAAFCVLSFFFGPLTWRNLIATWHRWIVNDAWLRCVPEMLWNLVLRHVKLRVDVIFCFPYKSSTLKYFHFFQN